MHHKPAVARGRFTLGAGQCVFLTCGRVQKHRKVLADGLKTFGYQFVRRGAHDNPIMVLNLQAQQGIANRTTHEKNLHPRSLAFRQTGA